MVKTARFLLARIEEQAVERWTVEGDCHDLRLEVINLRKENRLLKVKLDELVEEISRESANVEVERKGKKK